MSNLISNELRKTIAKQLTIAAIQKQPDEIGLRLEELNTNYWLNHIAIIESISGANRNQWRKSILHGVMTATTSVTLEIEFEDPKYSVSTLFDITNCRHGFDAVIEACPMTAAYIKLNKHTGNPVISLQSEESVPRVNDMYLIEVESQFNKTFKDIAKSLEVKVSSAESFYNGVMRILYGIRTKKQLAEQLPEAVQYLPVPEHKPSSNLVPVEFIESIRKQIESGIGK